MPTYQYSARDQSGRRVKGVLDAPDERALVNLLREKNLSIVSIEEAKNKKSVFRNPFGKSVNFTELVIFTRQMATMIGAAIPLLQCIEVLEEQTEDRNFKSILAKVRRTISAGSNLSNALSREEGAFSDLYINMIKAGEEGGSLDVVMERLANYLESTQRLIRKVKSAMVYPAVVIVMAVSITILLLVKVIPVFKQMYADFGATLPGPTQVLISLSDFLIANALIIVIFIAACVIAFQQVIRTKGGKYWWDGMKLKFPIFGGLIRKLAISKFTRTLSTLIQSGVPILAGLEIVARTAGNKVLEKTILNSRLAIRDGARMADPLRNSSVFPPLVVRMISIGETTGELEKMLNKIADFYEDQTEAMIQGMTSIIEPVIIAFLGIVVGGIVICMFLPIFSLSQIINV